MKRFTIIINKVRNSKFVMRFGWIILFYALMMLVYMYIMHADLSTAPKFIYSQF